MTMRNDYNTVIYLSDRIMNLTLFLRHLINIIYIIIMQLMKLTKHFKYFRKRFRNLF